MKPEPFQRGAQACGMFAALLGTTAFLGWILNVPIMRGFVPGRSEMKFNTALALMCSGSALMLLTRGWGWKKISGRGLAVAVLLIGAATLSQYIFNVSLGIDEFLMKDLPNAVATTSPGRMSPQAAFTFICLSLALLYLDTPVWGRQLSHGLAIVAAIFPLQLLIHHLYGGNMVLGFGAAQYSLMALPTTLALLSVSAGALLARPKSGLMVFVTSRTFAGDSLRRLLTLGLLVPSSLGAIILFALDGKDNTPSFAVSAFATFGTLAFCALLAQHAHRLHAAELEREKAEKALRVTMEELQEAHRLLGDRAHQLESLVQKRTAALRDANEQLETFVFSIAHDLRAPIRAQWGFAQHLEEKFSERLGPEGSDAARRVRASAEKLSRMVEELLTYARVGRSDWQIEAVLLAPLLKAAQTEMESDLRAKAGTLIIDPTNEAALGHRATLLLSVMNLVSNAIKFTAPGVPPEVRIWTEAMDGVVRVCVRDNGIGIPPQYKEKIFGIFQRLHSSSEYPGTGVGLALVRRGVERMGGKVDVQSAPGAGSTFCLELPRSAPEVVKLQNPNPAREGIGSQEPGGTGQGAGADGG